MTFNIRSLLGAALLKQEKTVEAEPHLGAGIKGMKQRFDKISSVNRVRLSEALDRLIQLAEATVKSDDSKAWKDEKAKLALEIAKSKVGKP